MVKRLYIALAALALCQPSQAAVVPWRSIHFYKPEYADWLVISKVININTISRVGNIAIVDEYWRHSLRGKPNMELPTLKGSTIYANCSGGQITIESKNGYRMNTVAVAPDAWKLINHSELGEVLMDDEGFKQVLDRLKNDPIKSKKFQIEGPPHRDYQYLYAMMCNGQPPPQYKEKRYDTQLS